MADWREDPDDKIDTRKILRGGPDRADLSGEIDAPPLKTRHDTEESPKVATGLWTELEVGDVLGTYRVVDHLPEGGMALLYAARHLRLQREAALKVLKPEYASRTREVRRFLEEARAIGEIHHPHIVEVYDFVEDTSRDPPLIYAVMELLRGEPLSARLGRQGALEPGQAIAIGSQVALALEAVHGASLLHRDLKASNIFLVEGEGIHVKLLDFGLTLPFGERQKLNLTDPGTTLGTPEYMSPEQILGHEMDPRSDIYMLGVVLYEMLTGTRPFTGNQVGDLLVRHVKELPQPPSQRRPGVPPALEQVALRCLEKEPKRRFQSMTEVRGALELGPSLPLDATRPVKLMPGPGAPRQWTRTLLVSVFLLLSGVGILFGLFYFTEDDGNSDPGTTAARRDASIPLDMRIPDLLPTADITAAASLDAAPARPDARPPRRPRPGRPRRGARTNKGLKSKPVAPTIDPWKLR